MSLNFPQLDRAAGTMLGLTCGDALGAGYEFQPRVPYTEPIAMEGGGAFQWAAGEWTDDTAMAMCIAQVSASGIDLRSEEAQDQIVRNWIEWARDASDVGVQTSEVISRAGSTGTAAAFRQAAREVHEMNGKSGGNGSLMRTAPVALAYLDDVDGLVEAARAISDLTHFESDTGDACVLWCLAIRHAVLTGELADMKQFLKYLPEDVHDKWEERIHAANLYESHFFQNNGWVVAAFQAALSAIVHAGIPAQVPSLGQFECQHFEIALERAVRSGGDTDTVAAIAGSLLGAIWGSTAVPSKWRLKLHGYPSASHKDLIELGILTATHGQPDNVGWPTIDVVDDTHWEGFTTVEKFKHESNVTTGGHGALLKTKSRNAAAISLCRVGKSEIEIAPSNHLTHMIIDTPDPADNPNIAFVFYDSAHAMADFLEDDKQVTVHCVQAHSRTPSVLMTYLMLFKGYNFDQALAAVQETLPDADPNPAFVKALREIGQHNPSEMVFHFAFDPESNERRLFREVAGELFIRAGGAWSFADETMDRHKITETISENDLDSSRFDAPDGLLAQFDEQEFCLKA